MQKTSAGLNPTQKKRFLAFFLLVSSGAVLYCWRTQPNLMAPIEQLRSSLCLSACEPKQAQQASLQALIGSNFEIEKISLLVEKSKYKLTVFHDAQPVKSYPIVLGKQPIGDKRAEGDRKTPEGIYHVRDLYPHPTWSKFIWLDYPTPQDWQEHAQAKLAGEIAPDATVGSEIGIHGVPDGADNLIDSRSNWTLGCISLKNADINEIYEVLTQGTRIEILP